MKSAGGTNTARKIPGAGIINTALAALALPIWLLALLAWAVQLAGLAAVQKQQGRHFVQFDWFVTSFEIFVLLVIPYHLLARRSTPGIVALKAVVTVLEILRTNVWNDARLGRGFAGQNYLQIDSITNPGLTASTARVNLLFSGYLITSFFNLLLLIAVGNLPSFSGQDVEYLRNKGSQAATQYSEDRGNHVHNGAHTEPLASNPGPPNSKAGTAGTTGTRHVPGTHLNETERDGLHGPTYLDGAGRNNYNNV